MNSTQQTLSSDLNGDLIVGGQVRRGQGKEIHGMNPATGEQLEPAYAHATSDDVADAAELAHEAFGTYRVISAERRATFLETIARNIETIAEVVVARAASETGLPTARLTGEVGRTTGQLRLFAGVVREGSWNGARIDPAIPDRKPLPRADIRLRFVPLGPVVVFAASNFPLAFSVAGGDTASALAAGCPVIVKAHDAHPGTSELVGRAIADAVAECGLPAGTFSLIFGSGPDIGTELVTRPEIAAVGFTGSRTGGLALVRAAAGREVPIPVYAEMSSINPVFMLPGALEQNGETLGAAFVGSLTMGSGQFCTNPGLIFGVDGPDLERFISSAASTIEQATATPMLTPAIAASYNENQAAMQDHYGVETRGLGQPASCSNAGLPALLVTDADEFFASHALQAEIFGATSLVVRFRDEEQMYQAIAKLEGQLTATVHATDADERLAGRLMEELESKVGRILFNGWPTGVEVGHAMVHGGPFPATSDSRTTSVGSLAIDRFLRPVSYQDVPPSLLPSAIADGNPDKIWRRVNGELTYI